MPVAFTVASLALDTGSYVMSGKTLTDHGLSLAMEEDCSMVRLLDEDDAICREKQRYEIADADLTPLPEDSELILYLASDDDPAGPDGYARLAERVHKARTIHAQLASRAHQARAVRVHYLAAGMMESEG